MEPHELQRCLVELAREAGLVVRPIRGGSGGEGEPPASSGVCRVGSATWVVLSAADSTEERIEVLARALRERAPAFLERRFLAPAVRERIGGAGGAG